MSAATKRVVIVAIITGIFGLIGIIIKGIFDIIVAGTTPLPPTPQVVNATMTVSPTLPPAATQSLTQIPTLTPIPTTPLAAIEQPIIQNGYAVYDDFSNPSTLQGKWWFEDSHKLCNTFTVENGELNFDCVNSGTADLGASLMTTTSTIHGAAILVKVNQSGGPFQLASKWKCDDGTERNYHMALSERSAEVYLYYPLEDWRAVQLTDPEPVAPERAHLLQIEAVPGNVQFLVDGKVIHLKAGTDFAPCLQMRNISLDFMIWKDNNRLKGQVDFFSIKP